METAQIKNLLAAASDKPLDERVHLYNDIVEAAREMLGMNHPTLAVRLVKAEAVQGNDYNPNKVAPPEMQLLKLSIRKDGLTMPVVANRNEDGSYTVVDGFHRVQTIKDTKDIYASLHGYVPIAELNKSVEDRITATVRHNMARGTHQTELSAKLVTLLKKHNWTDARIGRELGMDPDEVLRLKQITGLAEAFSDREFSKAWEPAA